jgi:hypothetical protein
MLILVINFPWLRLGRPEQMDAVSGRLEKLGTEIVTKHLP